MQLPGASKSIWYMVGKFMQYRSKCMCHRQTGRQMTMKIGRKYNQEKVYPRQGERTEGDIVLQESATMAG